ncbi:MAG: hydrolase [Gammaproteobacteria bacterium]|nr:hydrolase [Gammaproteobacteria bacterium]
MDRSPETGSGQDQAGFRPAWWLPSPHLQTLWPVLARRPRRLALTRERVELADGDFIDLAACGPESGPGVLIIHGLEGSLNSHYATPLLNALAAAGCRARFMHLRGCSEEPNRLARSYHSGASDDLREVLAWLRARDCAPRAAVGFSLGGNLLLKHLGESGADSGLACAVAVSVPFRLEAAVQRMDTGVSRIYGRYLLNRLKSSYRRRCRHRATVPGMDLDRIDSIRAFDDRITAPLNGFADAADYYRRCSAAGYVGGIVTPTLILHARDDPFMYPDTVPAPGDLGPGVTLALSERGGHVGFVAGRFPWRPIYWAEQRILAWLRERLPLP